MNDCIFCHPVLSDICNHNTFFFFCFVNVIYATVTLKNYREELQVSAELDTLRRMHLNRFKIPTDQVFFLIFRYKTMLLLSTATLVSSLENSSTLRSYQTHWDSVDYWFNSNHAYVMIWNCDEKKYIIRRAISLAT